MTCTFYLGTHRPHWLKSSSVPLMVSMHTLARYRGRGDNAPKARCHWALDSGAFSELSAHGEWSVDPDTFGGRVYRLMDDLGTPPDFVSIQDWMCEPHMLAKTGLTVADHQALTLDSYLYLREEFPDAPWLPILQGWTVDDYLAHVEAYRAAGVDLAAAPLVGLGSVCRRSRTSELVTIVGALAARGLRLHGFGVKVSGLARCAHQLASADSLSWSAQARYEQIRMTGCTHVGICNNCRRWAETWYGRVQRAIAAPKQLDLFTHLFAA
ncbi:hypothetical protein [Catellatospora sp. NPDC049133]|uniref:deazapurine DNA modification protein DpdA family protein n=1 Tax=Catellatospora sp. NPDC049133 TaxID=3155499 RepID=UPI0033D856F2